MAKEYIEREALYNGLVKAYSVLRNMCLGLYMDSEEDARRAERFQPMLNAFLYCIRKVKSAPAADVVEVVRCKDYRFRSPKYDEPDGYYGCDLKLLAIDLDCFCSEGERIENGGK